MPRNEENIYKPEQNTEKNVLYLFSSAVSDWPLRGSGNSRRGSWLGRPLGPRPKNLDLEAADLELMGLEA